MESKLACSLPGSECSSDCSWSGRDSWECAGESWEGGRVKGCGDLHCVRSGCSNRAGTNFNSGAGGDFIRARRCSGVSSGNKRDRCASDRDVGSTS